MLLECYLFELGVKTKGPPPLKVTKVCALGTTMANSGLFIWMAGPLGCVDLRNGGVEKDLRDVGESS